MTPEIALIKWTDAYAECGWMAQKDIKELPICVSVGYVVKETDHQISRCQGCISVRFFCHHISQALKAPVLCAAVQGLNILQPVTPETRVGINRAFIFCI